MVGGNASDIFLLSFLDMDPSLTDIVVVVSGGLGYDHVNVEANTAPFNGTLEIDAERVYTRPALSLDELVVSGAEEVHLVSEVAARRVEVEADVLYARGDLLAGGGGIDVDTNHTIFYGHVISSGDIRVDAVQRLHMAQGGAWMRGRNGELSSAGEVTLAAAAFNETLSVIARHLRAEHLRSNDTAVTARVIECAGSNFSLPLLSGGGRGEVTVLAEELLSCQVGDLAADIGLLIISAPNATVDARVSAIAARHIYITGAFVSARSISTGDGLVQITSSTALLLGHLEVNGATLVLAALERMRVDHMVGEAEGVLVDAGTELLATEGVATNKSAVPSEVAAHVASVYAGAELLHPTTLYIGNMTIDCTDDILITAYGQQRDGRAWHAAVLGDVVLQGNPNFIVFADAGVRGASGLVLQGLINGTARVQVDAFGGGQFNSSRSGLNSTREVLQRRCGVASYPRTPSVIGIDVTGQVEIRGRGGSGGTRGDGVCVESIGDVVFRSGDDEVLVAGLAGIYTTTREGGRAALSGVHVQSNRGSVSFQGYTTMRVVGVPSDDSRSRDGFYGLFLKAEHEVEVLGRTLVSLSGEAQAKKGVTVGVWVEGRNFTTFSDGRVAILGRVLAVTENRTCEAVRNTGLQAALEGPFPSATGVVFECDWARFQGNVALGGSVFRELSHGEASGVTFSGRDELGNFEFVSEDDVMITGSGGSTLGGAADGITVRHMRNFRIGALGIVSMGGLSGRARQGRSVAVRIDVEDQLELSSVDSSVGIVGRAPSGPVEDAEEFAECLNDADLEAVLDTTFLPSQNGGLVIRARAIDVYSEDLMVVYGYGTNVTYCEECHGIVLEADHCTIVSNSGLDVKGTAFQAFEGGHSNVGIKYVGNSTLDVTAPEIEVQSYGGDAPLGRGAGMYCWLPQQVWIKWDGDARLFGVGGTSNSSRSYGENYGIRWDSTTGTVISMDSRAGAETLNDAGRLTIDGEAGSSLGDGNNVGVSLGVRTMVLDLDRVTIDGVGAPAQNSGGNIGVELEMSMAGNVSIVGVRGTAGASDRGRRNIGVLLSNSNGAHIGNISNSFDESTRQMENLMVLISGIAAFSPDGGNAGVHSEWSAAVGGNVTIGGTGAPSDTGCANYGVRMAPGDGSLRIKSDILAVTGTAGPCEVGERNIGVSVDANRLELNGGIVAITGYGAPSAAGGEHFGVEVVGRSMANGFAIFSGNDTIISGVAGSSNSSLGQNAGVRIAGFRNVNFTVDNGVTINGDGAQGWQGENHGVVVSVTDFYSDASELFVGGSAGPTLASGNECNGIQFETFGWSCADSSNVTLEGYGGAGLVDSAGVALLSLDETSVQCNLKVLGTSGPGGDQVDSYGVRFDTPRRYTPTNYMPRFTFRGGLYVEGKVLNATNTTVDSDQRYGIYKGGVELNHLLGSAQYNGTCFLRSLLNGGPSVLSVSADVTFLGDIVGTAGMSVVEEGSLLLEGDSPGHAGKIHVADMGSLTLDGFTGCSVEMDHSGTFEALGGAVVGGDLELRGNSTLYPGGNGTIGCMAVLGVARFFGNPGNATAATVFDITSGGNTPCVHHDQVQVRDVVVFHKNTIVVDADGSPSSGLDFAIFRVKRGYFGVVGQLGPIIGADYAPPPSDGNEVLVQFIAAPP
eukprot:TRINITY_DN1449_c0_g1_i1.p1 TRINITY_DN1449_c0_g1~~TRINITY_DN1449_c0_g1_i1.p1  ORF type:complete len:1772 (-),score=404.63 TRINITY_DN1449_c0_g1_i1:224-5155(-)